MNTYLPFHARSILAGAALLLAPLLAGCDQQYSDVAPVTGQVTLDGQPLADASVKFQPEEGRASAGTTDAEGRYTLHYTPQQEGAEVGSHTVEITTMDESGSGRYSLREEFQKEVEPSENTIDFELTSS